MTATHRKIVSDLAQEGVRTGLVVCGIAVGIAGFLAVLSCYAILTRELNVQYLATNPASAILRVDRVDEALVASVRTVPGVRDAEGRRTLSAQIKGSKSGWVNLRLFVVPDFAQIRIAKLNRQEGGWPPAAGEILIERDAMQVAHLRIGDTVKVKTSAGRQIEMRVGGTVHDVGQAQARMENIVYGYIPQRALADLGEAPYLDRLNIVVSGNAFDERYIQSVAAGAKKFLEARGHAVQRVDIPTPGEHPHGKLMGMLLLIIASFGFCILALSGILVATLLTGMMAAQIRQIGVMKAIGGSTRQIATLYFAESLLLGVAAVAVAIAPGIFGGRALCRAMAVFLNFDIDNFAVPAWVFLLAAAAGILVPLVAAAVPVWNVARVPARDALTGVADAFGVRVLDRLLLRIEGPARPVLLSVRNAFRHPTRLLLTLATLSAGGLFFLSALNIRASLVETLDRFFAARRFDLMVSLSALTPQETVERATARTAGVTRAESWLVLDGLVSEKERIPAVGISNNTSVLAMEIISGRAISGTDRDVVVINSALADTSAHPVVGQMLAVQVGEVRLNLRVVGITRELFAGPAAYVPIGMLQAATRHDGLVNTLRVVLAKKDRASIDAAKAAIEANFERESVRTRGISSTADSRYGFDQHMLMIYVFLVTVSTLIAGIGGLGLMTTMSLNVLERRREMGVLRAIGATPKMILAIVAGEGATVALSSWLIAVVVSWPVSRVLGDLVSRSLLQGSLQFRVDSGGVLIWLAVAGLLGVTASVVPAWTASRDSVREAISHE